MIESTSDVAFEDAKSSVSWGAIFAGGVASAALTLALVAFGAGVGFSVVSPWAGQGISGTTFSIAAGLYLVAMAMIASTIGGYLTGRLRSKWATVHEHERYFRDTAHGLLAWAVGTLLIATVLGTATTHIVAGVGAGLVPAAASASAAPADKYVDQLLRTDSASPPAAAGNDSGAARAELSRILAPTFNKNGALSAADRTYVAKMVSARTGISQADAEQRVDLVMTQAKAAADDARKSAAKLSLWLVASLLAGALAASLAAVEGGALRNREWYLATR